MLPQHVTTTRPRCIAYIDGFNWYHAIFKHRPEWKWLNIYAYFQALRPREEVVTVKLFSAMKNDPYERDRQQRYFDALRTIPQVQIILGVFQTRDVTCRSDCGKVYTIQEEKKTDVNLAVEIMSDAISGCCDMMCIATADSDVQPAVEWVARYHPNIKLIVYIPAMPMVTDRRRTDYYRTKGLNVECMAMPLHGLSENQLPGVVKLGNGYFAARPHLWVTPSAQQGVT